MFSLYTKKGLKMRLSNILFVIPILLFCPLNAEGGLYKWWDEKGQMHITDYRPEKKEKDIPHHIEGPLVTLDLTQADIREILSALDKSAKNITISVKPEVKGKVSIKKEKINFEDALFDLLRVFNRIYYKMEGDVCVVGGSVFMKDYGNRKDKKSDLKTQIQSVFEILLKAIEELKREGKIIKMSSNSEFETKWSEIEWWSETDALQNEELVKLKSSNGIITSSDRIRVNPAVGFLSFRFKGSLGSDDGIFDIGVKTNICLVDSESGKKEIQYCSLEQVDYCQFKNDAKGISKNLVDGIVFSPDK